MTKEKDDGGVGANSAPFNNPFVKLSSLKPQLAAGPTTASPAKQKPAPARAVVRMERKGHGGKEVTLIEQLELPRTELQKWLRELKSSFGCGGKIIDTALQLQGDQRERIQDWLVRRGVKRISMG